MILLDKAMFAYKVLCIIYNIMGIQYIFKCVHTYVRKSNSACAMIKSLTVTYYLFAFSAASLDLTTAV